MNDIPAHRPLVSLVIATRNRADCLPRALDSVYAQAGRGSLFDVEVIVVDDASSDTTHEVLQRYDGVRVIKFPDHRGVGAALNAGLRISTGKYISMLGDDDEWLSHKLRSQIPELDAHPEVGVVYSQCLVRRDSGEEYVHPLVTRAPSGSVFTAMLMENFCGHHSSALFRREVFHTAGYFDESLRSSEDYDLSLRVAFHFRFRFIPGVVDIYNLSSGGLWLTCAKAGTAATDVARVIDKALRMLPDSAQYAALRREASVRVRYGAVLPLLEMGELVQAWAMLLEVLDKYPSALRYEWARRTVTRLVCARALAAEMPMAAARHLCAEITSAVAAQGLQEHLRLRKTLAMVWAWLALTFVSHGSIERRDVVRAAARAMAHAPVYLAGRVLREIARVPFKGRIAALRTRA